MPDHFVESFPPLVGTQPRLLILGSMPGVASLRAAQYYAHPQNLFWRLLGEFIGFDPQSPYAERALRITQAGIAVWDVLAHCQREGSLDAAIQAKTARANDFADFFSTHPSIAHVCFNGAAAAQLYRRHVLAQLHNHPSALTLRYHPLPSSSPANASIPLAQKQAVWHQALQFCAAPKS